VFEKRLSEPAGGGADHSESDVAGDVVAQRRQVMFDRTQLGEDSSSAGCHDFTFVGQFPLGPIDQGCADFLFEAGNVGRHVRLHRVKRSSSSGERSMFSDGQKGMKLAKIHLHE